MRLNQRRWLTAGARASAAGSAMTATRPPSSIGLEDIARAPHGLEIAGEFGIVLDLAPEPRHRHVAGAAVPADRRPLGEGLARQRLAGLARERQEERRLRRGEVDGLGAA